MRTTVTIDSDVELKLRSFMRDNGLGFKAALNQALRRGLVNTVAEDEAPYTVSARPMGLKPGIDPAHLNQLLDDLEAEEFSERPE